MNSLCCGRILGSLAVLFSISSSEYVTNLALFVENKSLNPILVSTFFFRILYSACWKENRMQNTKSWAENIEVQLVTTRQRVQRCQQRQKKEDEEEPCTTQRRKTAIFIPGATAFRILYRASEIGTPGWWRSRIIFHCGNLTARPVLGAVFPFGQAARPSTQYRTTRGLGGSMIWRPCSEVQDGPGGSQCRSKKNIEH